MNSNGVFYFYYRVSLHVNIKPALDQVQNTVKTITSAENNDLRIIVSRMSLSDLNRALYRCEQEERDESSGAVGVYDIPGYGPLVYSGLQGKK